MSVPVAPVARTPARMDATHRRRKIPCVKLALLGGVGDHVGHRGVRRALLPHGALEELELVLRHRVRTLGDGQQSRRALRETCCPCQQCTQSPTTRVISPPPRAWSRRHPRPCYMAASALSHAARQRRAAAHAAALLAASGRWCRTRRAVMALRTLDTIRPAGRWGTRPADRRGATPAMRPHSKAAARGGAGRRSGPSPRAPPAPPYAACCAGICSAGPPAATLQCAAGYRLADNALPPPPLLFLPYTNSPARSNMALLA